MGRAIPGSFYFTYQVRGAVSEVEGTKPREPLNEAAIEKIIEGRGTKDEVEETYGPTKVGEVVLWEVWVTDRDDHWATRFVEVFDDDSSVVYDTFQALAVALNKRLEAASERRQDLEWRRTRELSESQHRNITSLIKLAVGSLAFLTVVGVFSFAFVTRNALATGVLVVLAGVISSGCWYIFGKYIRPSVARSTGTLDGA